ncbi:MAG: 1-deoxy-D-xylulose-5-phosphate synthase [Oscillospiraceae bacterium]|nr:1-deoxy-D-xylulose-5-phosphate synthase [Oscillospiraceae bacterium]
MSALETLCAEIREFLISNVSVTGGHLSSNLGTVELTVALHKAFDSPRDKIVFDVGHQCYTHKILTGRKAAFKTLRQQEGLSGFPCIAESPHDPFIAGHGSTSISAAIGLARAKKLKKEPGYVIAVIGDGAFTGGMVYEGINNIDTLDNLIVILNDNKMSISKNVGAVARYLTTLRTNPHYYKAKKDVKSFLNKLPLIGKPIERGLQRSKSALRRAIYKSTWFEEMGFQYIGPVDGHDLTELCNLFENIKGQGQPVFIHAITIKGKGFTPAEENPGAFHGVGAFDAQHVADPDVAPAESFSAEFGKKLSFLANTKKDICAITAAMKYGTGLNYFSKRHRERFFDVGMAEQHAVTFAAGLARGGLRPVVCIYSTFLQRSFDQIIHDVVLQRANVFLAVDRAGLVPGDGETHQGIYDAAYLSQQGVPVYSPCNYAELRYWMEKLLELEGPKALRYPRGEETAALSKLGCSGADYDRIPLKLKNQKAAGAIVVYGALTEEALSAQQLLEEAGFPVVVFKLTRIYPLPAGLCEELMDFSRILFAEEGIEEGGIAQQLASALLERGYSGRFHIAAVRNRNLDHASTAELRARLGLDGKSLAKQWKEGL